MPTIYYKDSSNTWQPLDIGNIKTGRFIMGSTSYSYNFDEPFADGYNKPVVVTDTIGTGDVSVVSASRNGFVVNSTSTPEVSFFAAQGEILTYENANGAELLQYYFDECKTDRSGSQRVANYFVDSVGTATWEQLSKISQLAAIHTSLFSGYVNKTKTVDMGSYGGSTVYRIAGVNHDTISGRGALTFISEKIISQYQMNTSNTTSGGWERSAMRSWLSGAVLKAMPSDLQNVIVAVNKTNTSGYGATTTSDKLWLPSYTEVGFGENEGEQYSIFTSNASRVRKLNNSAEDWWLRSVNSSRTFRYVDSDGTLSDYGAGATNGVVPGFCV